MDVLVPGASEFGLVGGVDLAQVGRLPEVEETADASAMLLFAGYTQTGRLIGPGDVFPVAAAGNALGSTFEKFTMLEGRAARPFEIREATASFLAGGEARPRGRRHDPLPLLPCGPVLRHRGRVAHPVRRAAQRPGP